MKLKQRYQILGSALLFFALLLYFSGNNPLAIMALLAGLAFIIAGIRLIEDKK